MIMKNRIYYFIVAALMLFGVGSMNVTLKAAPVTTLPYFCSFEETAENAQWQLNLPNPGAVMNQWVVSSAQAYTGSQSLILSGNGADALYWAYYPDPNDLSYTEPNANTMTFAAREFTLPAGTYDLSFAWAGGGAGMNGGFDFMAVAWVPASSPIQAQANPTAIPTWFANGALTFDGAQMLYQSRFYWIEEMTQVVSTGAPMKLVFMWLNNDLAANQPSAMIDNVYISSCTKPTNVSLKNAGSGSATLEWTGTASSYEVAYVDASDPSGVPVTTTVSSSPYTFTGLNSGTYQFAVRSICGPNDTSMWADVYEILDYTPDAGCVDFLDLASANCVYGQYAPNCADANGDGICDFTYVNTGLVDEGFRSRVSRHTVHYPGETDQRTEDKLTTVPPGEEASVRLGNWNNMGETEAIEYTMNIPANANKLLTLKYAVVFEAPGHGPILDPGFTMMITDQSGNPLDACTTADFFGDESLVGTNGWHKSNEYEGVVWKDWTTVGFNLQAYAGQTIKIQLTTQDCLMYKHFAYAYFTLGCSDAEIKGVSCGKNTTDTISAPDGFDYEWYKTDNPGVVVSRDQHFALPKNDPAAYECKVISKENPACVFKLKADMRERYPVADFALTSGACSFTAQFKNNSAVEAEGVMTTEDCETYEWDFGDGQTSTDKNPQVTYSAPGTYKVKLIAGLSGKLCTDTMEMDVTVSTSVRDTIYHQICQGDTYTYNGVPYTTAGKYTHTFKTAAGCDSIVLLDLSVVAVLNATINHTICDGESYTFNGTTYTTSGTYTHTSVSVGGCDSITTLNLTVQSASAVTLNESICEGDAFYVGGNAYNTAGSYTINLKTKWGCDSVITLHLDVVDKIEKTLHDTICFGDSYTFGGKTYTKTGIYTATMTSSGGCDSVVTLHLLVGDEITFTAKAYAATGGPNSGRIEVTGANPNWTYTLNGVPDASLENLPAGNYTIIYYDERGCASDPVTVAITADCLEYAIGELVDVCADDNSFMIPFSITKGSLVDYDIIFSDEAKSRGFVDMTDVTFNGTGIVIDMPVEQPRPNTYSFEIVLNDLTCGEKREAIPFNILYSSNIMQQKWNDVIALYNKDFNGGYEFTAYQWYQNGKPLGDQAGPYLYLYEGATLDTTAHYSVRLTRADDGKSIMSCTMMPTLRVEEKPAPTLSHTTVSKGTYIQVQNVSGDAMVTWYDLQGKMCGQQEIDENNNNVLVPSYVNSGLYMLEIQMESEQMTHKIFIK